MKRVLPIVIIVIMLISFSACASRKAKFENFADCKADFETVSNFLRSYYMDQDYSGSATFEFIDGDIWKDSLVVSEEYAEELKTLQQNGFTYVWVEKEHTIFWQDETKAYGVLFSENPKAALETVKEWYDGLKSKKLDENWYEIGALDSI